MHLVGWQYRLLSETVACADDGQSYIRTRTYPSVVLGGRYDRPDVQTARVLHTTLVAEDVAVRTQRPPWR
jgi:hypothetical protein